MRPYIIAHMLSSLDGRIDSLSWTSPDIDPAAFGAAYEAIHNVLKADAWIAGRTTMEEFAQGKPASVVAATSLPRETFKAAAFGPYAVAVDASGKLHWSGNTANGDHVIEVLTEQVPDSYLGELRAARVSYLFAGVDQLDLRLAVEKLRTEFGVERLLLEGGGRLNGSFLAADLVDEVSLLLAPVLDATPSTPNSFDHPGRNIPKRLTLKSFERQANDLLWLRYAA